MSIIHHPGGRMSSDRLLTVGEAAERIGVRPAALSAASDEPRTPWQRQPGESTKAFAAFCLYRDLGPGRSVVGAYRQRTGKESARQADGRWNDWARRWHWPARAATWDDEQDWLKVQAQLKKIEETAERHANLSVDFLQKIIERMRTIDADALGPRDLQAWFETAVKIERLSRGEPDSIQESRDRITVIEVSAQLHHATADGNGQPPAPPQLAPGQDADLE
jgi:hypothetical protein